MHIAIVQTSKLTPDISGYDNWSVDYFSSSKEFGKVKLDKYDAIIVDSNLQGTSGISLINALSEKVDIEFALLKETDIGDDIVNNEKISAVVNKNSEEIINWLKYIDIKIRLKKSVATEKDKYNDILSLTNGFSLTVKNNIAILGFSKPLSTKGRATILSAFESADAVIVYFSNNHVVTSTYLGELIFLYREVTKNDKKFIFVSNDEHLTSLMDTCNLSKIMPVMPTEQEAIDFVTSQTQHTQKDL